MKALSIRQPWAWLIVNGHKDIENRNWPTKYRGSVLIHAGVKFEHEDEEALLDVYPELCLPASPREYGIGGIVGIAEIVDCVTRSESDWFNGPYGFVMRNARPLPFVPMRGMLGFFETGIISPES